MQVPLTIQAFHFTVRKSRRLNSSFRQYPALLERRKALFGQLIEIMSAFTHAPEEDVSGGVWG
jgi:choline-glycine betaine transporter